MIQKWYIYIPLMVFTNILLLNYYFVIYYIIINHYFKWYISKYQYNLRFNLFNWKRWSSFWDDKIQLKKNIFTEIDQKYIYFIILLIMKFL